VKPTDETSVEIDCIYPLRDDDIAGRCKYMKLDELSPNGDLMYRLTGTLEVLISVLRDLGYDDDATRLAELAAALPN
jgi:hypothetical protein